MLTGMKYLPLTMCSLLPGCIFFASEPAEPDETGFTFAETAHTGSATVPIVSERLLGASKASLVLPLSDGRRVVSYYQMNELTLSDGSIRFFEEGERNGVVVYGADGSMEWFAVGESVIPAAIAGSDDVMLAVRPTPPAVTDTGVPVGAVSVLGLPLVPHQISFLRVSPSGQATMVGQIDIDERFGFEVSPSGHMLLHVREATLRLVLLAPDGAPLFDWNITAHDDGNAFAAASLGPDGAVAISALSSVSFGPHVRDEPYVHHLLVANPDGSARFWAQRDECERETDVEWLADGGLLWAAGCAVRGSNVVDGQGVIYNILSNDMGKGALSLLHLTADGALLKDGVVPKTPALFVTEDSVVARVYDQGLYEDLPTDSDELWVLSYDLATFERTDAVRIATSSETVDGTMAVIGAEDDGSVWVGGPFDYGDEPEYQWTEAVRVHLD